MSDIGSPTPAARFIHGVGRAAGVGHDMLVRLERGVSASLMAGVLVLLATQVFSRYVLNSPLAWTDELARFALIWLTFIAAGLVQAGDEHIAVYLLASRGGHRARQATKVLANLVPLLIGAVWIYTGLEPVQRGMFATSTATNLPMAVIYASTLVGFGLIVIHCVANIARTVRRDGQATSTDVASGGQLT